ncbi:hypothetical protein [Pajaroellobacter abortibovis]|uniref:hypothetical protein n=1 Tax=Pajaroellobacter abortibovis TaxID=1882918 RepID=UPI0012ECB867|nr:hypothetical protein [Pajaroellobacter abortibovis]
MAYVGRQQRLATTGANLYHDAHRAFGHRIREIDQQAGANPFEQRGLVASTTWDFLRRP